MDFLLPLCYISARERRRKMGQLARAGLTVIMAFLVGAALGCAPSERPEEEAESAPVEVTSASLERGEYLVNNVMHCFACHGEVDYESPGLTPVPGTEGQGGPFPEVQVPYPLNCANITPDPETGAGTWTDEQMARAIRDGIGHDGRVLFPAMPYPSFRAITDEDLASVVAYLRSIPPISNEVPATPAPEPIQQAFQPLTVAPRPPAPDLSDPVQRGQYLANLANCADCHTPLDETGMPIAGLQWAGGRLLVGRWGNPAAANLTPDASGIPYYNEELFLKVMRTGNPGGREINPIMVWGYFQGMTDEDLKAIFAYLQTLEPVRHNVDNTEPPSYCKLCRQEHGYGDRN
jgi:mono/diheme cytochrome c family protein